VISTGADDAAVRPISFHVASMAELADSAAHADHVAGGRQKHLLGVLREQRGFGERFVAGAFNALPRAHRKQAHQRHSRQSRHDDPKHEDREQPTVDAKDLTHGADLEQKGRTITGILSSSHAADFWFWLHPFGCLEARSPKRRTWRAGCS